MLEIQADAIQKGQKVVILDDLLATGGEYAKSYNLMIFTVISWDVYNQLIEEKDFKGYGHLCSFFLFAIQSFI